MPEPRTLWLIGGPQNGKRLVVQHNPVEFSRREGRPPRIMPLDAKDGVNARDIMMVSDTYVVCWSILKAPGIDISMEFMRWTEMPEPEAKAAALGMLMGHCLVETFNI